MSQSRPAARHCARPKLMNASDISIGGDAIIGSTYAELMPLFDADPQTEAIAIYSEPGGRAGLPRPPVPQRARAHGRADPGPG